jgi:curved DNA-binding protein
LIRLSGQGEPGIGGAPSGDLLLEVHFNPHPRFRVEGRNLHLDLPVAPWEAALGAIIPLDLPSGPLKLRIPAGAQHGRQLQVRGRGIPGDPPGDLILDIRIVVPPADTPRARELYETMARDLAFDPRQRS